MERKNEGLNFFYKAIALSLLFYMNKYSSINYRKTLGKIREILKRTNTNLTALVEDSMCAPIHRLEEMELYKKKHLVYSAYLAAISSYPTLYRVGNDEDVANAIFAKTASILSIKVLDNINDTLHNYSQAIESLDRQEEALTTGIFNYNPNNDFVAKAENSTHVMARWAHDTLRNYVDDSQYSFNLYKEDLRKYLTGQKDSFKQKNFTDGHSESLCIRDYLMKIAEKGVGTIWFDMDLCIFEKKKGGLSEDDIAAIRNIKTGLDYIYKSTLLYDDVCDLIEDSKWNIINSVMLLGIEMGKCSMNELNCKSNSDARILANKLEKHGAVSDAIHLADLLFLKGINHLLKAKYYSTHVDIKALTFNARFLRLFNLRKWVMREKSYRSLVTLLRSADNFEKLHSLIPEHIISYEKFL